MDRNISLRFSILNGCTNNMDLRGPHDVTKKTSTVNFAVRTAIRSLNTAVSLSAGCRIYVYLYLSVV